jgi:hypothetical protein
MMRHARCLSALGLTLLAVIAYWRWPSLPALPQQHAMPANTRDAQASQYRQWLLRHGIAASDIDSAILTGRKP